MSFPIAWHCRFCGLWNRWFNRSCKDCYAAKERAMDAKQ